MTSRCAQSQWFLLARDIGEGRHGAFKISQRLHAPANQAAQCARQTLHLAGDRDGLAGRSGSCVAARPVHLQE